MGTHCVTHIAWGWTILLVSDETELKLDQFCLSAPRPASDCLWRWKLNPTNKARAHTKKRWISWAYFVASRLEKWAGPAELDGTADDTLNSCVTGDSGYEMNAVTQTEHLGWKACVYTTELRWWWRERKPGHYSKLKLKALCKPSEIYHFSVSTKYIHRRPRLACNLYAGLPCYLISEASLALRE